MALANFIDKAALNASQILTNYNRGNFESILLRSTIEIAFDENAVNTSEGKNSLDMLTRLVARLYPKIKIQGIKVDDETHRLRLINLARSINPVIDISETDATIRVVVGKSELPSNETPTIYIGSENWIVKFSTNKAVGSSNYNNPFASGIAACIASANIFRFIFKESLAHGSLDSDFSLSIFTFSKTFQNNGPEIGNITIPESTLVGLGAIGNGFIWALNRISSLAGVLNIIDDEKIELSNLQRYLITDQNSLGHSKVEIAINYFGKTNLNIYPHPYEWGQFLQKRDNWNFNQVAIAVDSARDRILIQGALPKKIFNAWTQLESLGISRHTNFIDSACLTCLYLPNSKTKNRSEEIAENLGLYGEPNEKLIRGYLGINKPVDEALIALVSNAKKINVELLLPYLGKPLEIFYTEVVCGGILLNLSNESGQAINVEVPCAFESAMAGVLLAAEIVIDAVGLRESIPPITKFNLLRPLSDYLLEDQTKHASGKCICQDEIFLNTYAEKYPTILPIQ